MISAAVLDAMVASGCTPEQIAAAVKASLAAREAEIEAKREYERNRKRAYRAGKTAASDEVSQAVPGTDRDNTGHHGTDGDIPEKVSLSPVPLLPPTPPNNPLTPNPFQKLSGARGFRLPEDWILTGPDLAYALSKGFSEGQTGEMFEKFTNHWWSSTGRNAAKKDWHKAWRVWVLNELPRARAGPGRSPVRATTVYQQKQLADLEAINGLEDFAKRSGGSGSSDFEDRIGHSSARSESLLGGSGGPFIDISAPRREAGG